jgi:hypothetical protein
MATDDEIKAALVAKLHRKGHYGHRKGVKVENLAQIAPVPSHDVGRARDLTNAMAKNDACPVIYREGISRDVVTLEENSRGWVKAWILRHDESALPWDLD